MKSIATLIALFASQIALADTTVLKCVVPSETNAVTMNIVLAADQSVDFITFELNQKSETPALFAQLEKGELTKQMSQGYVNMLVLTEETSQEEGVITKAGFLGLSQDTANSFSGFIAAFGNIYPLACTK